MYMKLASRLALTPVIALIALGTTAFAADAPKPVWKPDHPVTIIVPYTPGGGADMTARAVSKQLGALWGKPVVVENFPGADGLIGTRKVMEAKPDGHTLLMQIPALVVTKHLPGLKGSDPITRLDPVSAVVQSHVLVTANPAVPAKSMKELVAYCKTAPEPCSIGAGETLARVWAKQLRSEGGLPNLIVVNYRGSSAVVADLLASHVTMSFTGITASLPHYKAGKLKILATQAPKRAAALPEVPTAAESGFPQFQGVTWFGLFAPKGTPLPIREAWVSALREVVKDPEVVKAITLAGSEPLVNSTQEFEAQVRRDAEYWDTLVKKYPLD